MALHALENVDDAYAVTRDYLGSLDRTGWAKLALVVLFVAGPGAGFTGPQFGVPGGDAGGPETPPPEEIPPFEVGGDFLLFLGALVVAAILLALLFAVVAAILEFVFVESLRTGEVAIRRYWSRRWRQGLRLFVFRFLVGLVVLATSALLIGLVAVPFAFDGGAGGVSILLLLLVVPVVVVLSILVGLINGFTTVFVVPIMILDDTGVLAGWRRLWPTITDQWTQYLAYVVASFVLTFVGAILVAVASGILAVLLLIPFGLLFALGVALATAVEPLGAAVLVVTGVLYVLAVVAAFALVQVPVQSYLRYYALLVLGDVDPALDLIPDRRTAVRAEATDTGDTAVADSDTDETDTDDTDQGEL